MKLLFLLLGGLLTVGLHAATLPSEVTIVSSTSMELMRDGNVSGSIGLAKGTKVEVIDLADDTYLLVRYRNANGRVRIASTNLPAPAPEAEDMMSAAPLPPPPVAAAKPATSSLQRTLSGTLVHLEGGNLKRFDGTHLAGVKFYALYFSASWCPPCRQFTPVLVEAYAKIRKLYPEFELVFVSNDYSAADTEAYMRNDRMQWPAIAYDSIGGAAKITHYAGPGIPCLVLTDENGKVLSDSYSGDHYLGPDVVLDDTWKTLRDYRAHHPR